MGSVLSGLFFLLQFHFHSTKEILNMKYLISLCLIFLSTSVFAADQAVKVEAPATSVTGVVLETKDVESYTYLRLKLSKGETWAAVEKSPVKKGSKVTVENIVVMTNFESKVLKKTFPTIIFGSLAGASSGMPAGHSGVAKTLDTSKIQVAKAVGENAYTVEEIVSTSSALKDKTVLVQAKVVKYNPGIMGKNWIHVRDGSGTDSKETNDILVTSNEATKVGDIVTVKGIVRVDKDFGAGYAYKVLIEEATIQK
jgi:hypothetical protein